MNTFVKSAGKSAKKLVATVRNYTFIALLAAIGGAYFGYHYSQTEQVKFQQALKALAPAASAQAVTNSPK